MIIITYVHKQVEEFGMDLRVRKKFTRNNVNVCSDKFTHAKYAEEMEEEEEEQNGRSF